MLSCGSVWACHGKIRVRQIGQYGFQAFCLCSFSLNFLQNRFNKVRIYRKGVPDRPQSYKKLSRKRLNNLAVSKECANFASV